MRLTKEQEFLCARSAILIASVGWIASAFAGLKGFPFWYGGFVVCFWVAFGLLNYPQKTSVWRLVNQRWVFVVLYGAFAGAAFLCDQFALRANLWFYPFYHGWRLLWVYLVLYPFGGLALLELVYFLLGLFGESLLFVKRKETLFHHGIDIAESVLFLLLMGGAVAGIAGWKIPLFLGFLIAVGWLVLASVKLFFHIRHWRQYALIFAATFAVAVLLHEIPNTVAFEWIYLEAPVLNTMLFSVPLWVWLGYYWLTLFVLRLWIFLVLHPKVR